MPKAVGREEAQAVDKVVPDTEGMGGTAGMVDMEAWVPIPMETEL